MDPTTRNISSYYTAPLGARRILEAVLPLSHDRNDPTTDTIYFHHPSARKDLHHPLILQPATQTHSPVNIVNYYITGVYSDNTHSDSSFNVYIYHPNDYEQTTDVIDIITLQLDSMRTAGYPTSPSGIHATTVTVISDDPPTP
jgi:hypothetical protein